MLRSSNYYFAPPSFQCISFFKLYNYVLYLHVYLYFLKIFLKHRNMNFDEFPISKLEASMELRIQSAFPLFEVILPKTNCVINTLQNEQSPFTRCATISAIWSSFFMCSVRIFNMSTTMLNKIRDIGLH